MTYTRQQLRDILVEYLPRINERRGKKKTLTRKDHILIGMLEIALTDYENDQKTDGKD